MSRTVPKRVPPVPLLLALVVLTTMTLPTNVADPAEGDHRPGHDAAPESRRDERSHPHGKDWGLSHQKDEDEEEDEEEEDPTEPVPPERFHHQGHIDVGNPATQAAAGVSEALWLTSGDPSSDGLDGDVVELPDWVAGRHVWVNGSSIGPYDLDVYFYDASLLPLGAGHPFDVSNNDCASANVNEHCVAPQGAKYLVANLFAGADVWVTAEAVDADGAPPVFTSPTYFTWSHEDVVDLQVVILPPVNGPIYYSDLSLFPEGDGILYDSPYLKTTLEFIESWRQALDAYAAAHPEAGYLDDIRWTTRIVGIDATVQDWVDADIAFSYGPTGGPVTAGGHYTIITPEGRYERCEAIPMEWLGASFTLADLYSTSSIEFGHCLGVYHVEFPATDIQNPFYDYTVGTPSNPRLCISSLDVATIAAAYHWMASGGTTWQPPPARIAEPIADYVLYPAVGGEQTACPNEV